MRVRIATGSLLVVAAVLAPGCLAPHDAAEEDAGPVGRVEDFSRLVSDGARPVRGTDEAGEAGEIEPSDPDDEVLAAVQEMLDDEEAQEPPAVYEESPYIRFGERIIVREYDDGTTFITKPYPMPPGKAEKVVQLMDALEPFPFRQRPAPSTETGEGAPLDPVVVQYDVLKDWDQEYYANLAEEVPKAAAPVNLSDVLVVTAVPDLLEAFEDFIDLFAAGVPQIELEAKIIEIVEVESTDLGVKPAGDAPIFEFGTNNFVRSLDFNFANTVDPTEALLTLGAVQDGVAFNAIIEAVESWQNVSIESRPKTVVRAGGVARLDSTQEIPFFDIKSITPTGGFNAVTAYKKVGIKLYISPRVIGSKTLALDVQLEGSQVVGSQRTVSQATEGGAAVDVPIIAYRTARSLVYLEPGQTLVIGGLTQERSQEIVNKVPILGDIPLLGLLFRIKFTQKEKEHVIFAISPRIVQRSEFDVDF